MGFGIVITNKEIDDIISGNMPPCNRWTCKQVARKVCKLVLARAADRWLQEGGNQVYDCYDVSRVLNEWAQEYERESR
ncbi:TPA: hypothetical protein HA278_01150 [Candidatus Woesearchaeota archaeon]|nr:hypothetical protein [Candidatus Woesearchaeota archaeon]